MLLEGVTAVQPPKLTAKLANLMHSHTLCKLKRTGKVGVCQGFSSYQDVQQMAFRKGTANNAGANSRDSTELKSQLPCTSHPKNVKSGSKNAANGHAMGARGGAVG